jgi:hypothetical protein
MKVTIEIEPEEAAKFIKSFMPDSVTTVVNNATWPMDQWNDYATKWINAIKDQHADDKE